MFRFTIRDLLWLTVVVGCLFAMWSANMQHRKQISTMQEQADELKRDGKVWEARAQSLKSDMLTGTNKNTDIEFIPRGIRYIPKKASSEPAAVP